MANVFISHRKSDDREAEQLATEIRNAGHHVWLDMWDINIGDSIVERMNEGLEGASYLILCYSTSGVTSAWMGREWMSALAAQLNGEGVKILPVILTGGQPPFILKDMMYVDLTRDWAEGVKRLLRSIK
jgi:hypothetical protein